MTHLDTPGATTGAYEPPKLFDLGSIHEQTATNCDWGPGPGDQGSDSGVVNDPDCDKDFKGYYRKQW